MRYNNRKWRCFHMKLNLRKIMTCRLSARSEWCHRAAAWMGLSFFLRMVYYFGFMNLNDISGFEIAFSVILPLTVSVAFILMLKFPRFSHPMAAAVLVLVFAVNYFFTEQMNFGGIFTGILLLSLGGMALAAVIGFIPQRRWILWAAMGVLLLRFLLVDLFGYILPLSELKLVAYIPRASNFFGVAAVCCLCAALKLRKID